jgi:hypothetical protein
VWTEIGDVRIQRAGPGWSFESSMVAKYARHLSGFDGAVIMAYAKGIATVRHRSECRRIGALPSLSLPSPIAGICSLGTVIVPMQVMDAGQCPSRRSEGRHRGGGEIGRPDTSESFGRVE